MKKYCVFDYESDSEYGLHVYHPEFKLLTCEFLFVDGDKKKFISRDSVESIGKVVQYAVENGFLMVCHNLSYEWLVTKRVFDIEIPPSQCMDTMRLQGCYGKGKSSLVAAVKDHFGVEDFKDTYHQWLIENHLAKNKEDAKGKVGHLPPQLLQEYNRADVEWTEKVYLHLVKKAKDNPLWLQDMELYAAKVARNSRAYLRGIRVDREAIVKNMYETEEEYNGYITAFKERYASEINKAIRLLAERAHKKDWDTRYSKSVTKDIKEKKVDDFSQEFNVMSNQQLEVLCVEVMGIKPRIFTEKGKPSFKYSFLTQWGEVGEYIKKWKKLTKPLAELKAFIEHSEVDGRIHLFVREGATKTGRGASSYGEN